MASELGGTRQVGDLLSEEMAAAPTITRLRRRLERPRALEAESMVAESPRSRWPIALDAASLIIATAATRLVSLLIGEPTPLVLWDVMFFVLVLSGFGLRGLYSPRAARNSRTTLAGSRCSPSTA